MTVHLVTFSDASMERSKELCLKSAEQHGVDGYRVPEWPETAYTIAYDKPVAQSLIKTAERGIGYWIWKPLIIDNALGALPDNEYLIYADAGIEFINNVNYIIDRMDQDIFLFGNNWEHAHWCKRDVIEAIWPVKADVSLTRHPDHPSTSWRLLKGYTRSIEWSDFGKQVQASVIFFRVSDYSRRFVKEWLDWCLFEGGRLIDDSPSRTPNHPEFREHRHDQAILTTMAYRDGLKLHYWPAMYNDGAFTYEKLPEYAEDDYPVLFHHHRRRNHEWEQVA